MQLRKLGRFVRVNELVSIEEEERERREEAEMLELYD